MNEITVVVLVLILGWPAVRLAMALAELALVVAELVLVVAARAFDL